MEDSKLKPQDSTAPTSSVMLNHCFQVLCEQLHASYEQNANRRWSGLRDDDKDLQFLRLKKDCARFEASALYLWALRSNGSSLEVGALLGRFSIEIQRRAMEKGLSD